MRKRKLNITLDVDGVLADFLQPSLDYLADYHGLHLRSRDIDRWSFVDIPVIKPYEQSLYKFWTTKGLAAGLPVIPGTQEVVAMLRRFADIRFATSPMTSNPTWIRERNAWLRKHFDARKADIRHTKTKSDVPADFFVDDKPENVIEYARNVPGIRGIYLRLWPYNMSFAGSGDPGFDNGFATILGLNEIIEDVEAAWRTLNSQPVKKTA